jgi:uncharacterized SAM-binding protein YcdF (DUF218 family)
LRSGGRWVRTGAAALAVWALVAWGAARALVVEAELGRADFIVVLGGAAAYRERAQHAARLYGEGRAPLVLLTFDGTRAGWSQAEQTNPPFVQLAREELLRAGVPGASVEVLPGLVTSTYEEATRVCEFAPGRGAQSVLVVTSAYHSRRALWTFRRVARGRGLTVGLSAAPAGGQTPPAAWWWLRPAGWRQVAAEYPKLIYYRITY